MDIIITITVGLVVGAFVMKLLTKANNQSERDLVTSQEKVIELKQQHQEALSKIEQLTDREQQSKTAWAVLQEKHDTLVNTLNEKDTTLIEIKETAETLRTNNSKALAQQVETAAQLHAEKETLASIRNDLKEAKQQNLQLHSNISSLRDENEKTTADRSGMLAELKAAQESQEVTRKGYTELHKSYGNLSISESDLKKHLATAQEKIVSFDKLEEEIKVLRRDNNQLTADRSELQTRLEEQGEQTQQKLQLLEDSKIQLKEQFKNLAQEIFEEKSTKFTEVNKEKLENLINPFKEQIKGFAERIHKNHENDFRDRTELKKEIENLHKLNATMSEEAHNLTRALKGDAKTQGNWGEVILERILEEAGLRQGVEYEREVSTNDSEGNRYRPDVIIHLPEKKDVIIDSKVSLVAYNNYIAATNEEDRTLALQAHLTSVKTHIKSLSDKNYEGLHEFDSLDYVLLFMPIEGAFRLAVEADPNLIFDASKKNIMLISPSTLMISLRTVHSLWQYEYQNQNAREIAERAGKLCDKFANFVNDMEDIGKHLDKVQNSFSDARGKLSSGRGNLIRQCQMLEDLGVKPKNQVPEKIRKEAFADDMVELADVEA